ncbi:MAG: YidC/Oxa1 family membrane protein insertase [Acidaminococcaceae bacterium]|nr:YidC/Oxa1 family membrane protein insertase [Acidaminococcaceae bacterium]MBP3812448.1 YidC/Oxa1 family membrane protein insertase [Acidaminococcaceae bacterium]
MDFISNFIGQIVQTLYHFLGGMGMPNYGLAIVLMTVIIKIILFPLTKKQIESTRAMMAIQPKMKEIQEKYKFDKVRLNQELAKLYQENHVNPLAGCLPLLIQMPILFGIYYAIRDFHYEGPANFLWMENIANPDPLYILPVLSAVTTYIQTKQTMPKKNPGDKQQDGLMGMMQGQMMTYFMPLFIGYISLSFPAGLVIYWIVMNIMQIGQQAYLNRQMDSK